MAIPTARPSVRLIFIASSRDRRVVTAKVKAKDRAHSPGKGRVSEPGKPRWRREALRQRRWRLVLAVSG